jgi:hypothetical protein
VLRSAWPPIETADAVAGTSAVERIALLLGSAAPPRAIASELGRIRSDLGVEGDPATDANAAAEIQTWFDAQRPVGGVSCDS